MDRYISFDSLLNLWGIVVFPTDLLDNFCKSSFENLSSVDLMVSGVLEEELPFPVQNFYFPLQSTIDKKNSLSFILYMLCIKFSKISRQKYLWPFIGAIFTLWYSITGIIHSNAFSRVT